MQEPWNYKGAVRGLNTTDHNIYVSACERPRTCLVIPKWADFSLIEQLTTPDATVGELRIEVNGSVKTVVIASVYLPFDSADLPPSNDLADLITWCEQRNRSLIVGADANATHPCLGSRLANSRR